LGQPIVATGHHLRRRRERMRCDPDLNGVYRVFWVHKLHIELG
jgi:hypothetical protein